jgi:hypothetical protein
MTVKNILSILLIVCVAFFITEDMQGGIENSHHDFRSSGWSDGQICIVCHTPHNADTSVVDSPLWNHEVTSATFTLYTSPTLDASLNQPSGHSKLCLSCHDGTIAVDSYGGQTGTHPLTSDRFGYIGTNLTAHHPISFAYDSNLASTDGELHDPGSSASGLGGTIQEDLLFSNQMECSSCHDVHVSRNTQGCIGCHFTQPGVTTESLSLRVSNSGSALCLTCHAK